MRTWVILLAAGSGTRLAGAGLPDAKQFITFDGAPLYWTSALTMSRTAGVDGLIFVFPPDRVAEEETRITKLDAKRTLGLPWRVVAGGSARQDSVACGLAAVPRESDAVLVHDTARPFASPALVTRVVAALHGGAAGVVPGIPLTDTVKEVADGFAIHTPDRSRMVAVQTPQGFSLPSLRKAHAAAQENGWTVTDDASLLERCGVPVCVVAGETANIKITTPEDLAMLKDAPAPPLLPCVGWGYDVHRFGEGRPMKLGGVTITNGPEVIAHSDGDVLLHALADALLGCIGGGDIGQHFPDTDAALDNVNSAILLDKVLQLTQAAGLRLTHVDLTLVAQVPKLAPWRDQIRSNVARLLALPLSSVNIKATTEEGLGFTGEKKGMKAIAAVTGLRPESA